MSVDSNKPTAVPERPLPWVGWVWILSLIVGGIVTFVIQNAFDEGDGLRPDALFAGAIAFFIFLLIQLSVRSASRTWQRNAAQGKHMDNVATAVGGLTLLAIAAALFAGRKSTPTRTVAPRVPTAPRLPTAAAVGTTLSQLGKVATQLQAQQAAGQQRAAAEQAEAKRRAEIAHNQQQAHQREILEQARATQERADAEARRRQREEDEFYARQREEHRRENREWEERTKNDPYPGSKPYPYE